MVGQADRTAVRLGEVAYVSGSVLKRSLETHLEKRNLLVRPFDSALACHNHYMMGLEVPTLPKLFVLDYTSLGPVNCLHLYAILMYEGCYKHVPVVVLVERGFAHEAVRELGQSVEIDHWPSGKPEQVGKLARSLQRLVCGERMFIPGRVG